MLALLLLTSLFASPPPARATAPPSPTAALPATAATTPAPTATLPDGARIRIELAVTPQEHQLGLMFRDSLAADHGMIFLFDEDGIYPFWMKNTFIPLDMVWLDGAGVVTEVRDNVQPCRADPCPSYTPLARARFVLELAAGAAGNHGVKTGTTLRFEGVKVIPVVKKTPPAN